MSGGQKKEQAYGRVSERVRAHFSKVLLSKYDFTLFDFDGTLDSEASAYSVNGNLLVFRLMFKCATDCFRIYLHFTLKLSMDTVVRNLDIVLHKSLPTGAKATRRWGDCISNKLKLNTLVNEMSNKSSYKRPLVRSFARTHFPKSHWINYPRNAEKGSHTHTHRVLEEILATSTRKNALSMKLIKLFVNLIILSFDILYFVY